jgi:hypothetical protein
MERRRQAVAASGNGIGLFSRFMRPADFAADCRQL